jgi:hypothetical protein
MSVIPPVTQPLTPPHTHSHTQPQPQPQKVPPMTTYIHLTIKEKKVEKLSAPPALTSPPTSASVAVALTALQDPK